MENQERETYGFASSPEGKVAIVNFIKVHKVLNREIDIAELENGEVLIITKKYPDTEDEEVIKKELLLTKETFSLLLMAMSGLEETSKMGTMEFTTKLSQDGLLKITCSKGSGLIEEEGNE